MPGQPHGKKVVILGGGFGGVAAARMARSLLPVEHSVTLIDRSRVTRLCGMNPMLIVGERDVRKTGRSLGQLANRGIEFVESEIDSIDSAGKTVKTGSGTFEYDYLIVGLGASYDWDAVPGSDVAYSFYNLETARRLRRRLSRFRRGRLAISVAAPPYKCPPAPFETAMMIHWYFRRRGIRRDAEIIMTIPEPAPLAIAGPVASAHLRNDLERRGIELRTGAGLTSVTTDAMEAGYSDGSSIAADVIVTVPVHRVPHVVAESGLTNGKPWTPVNAGTLETSTQDVFAIGDVNVVPVGEGRAIPKAGVFAAGQGESVAATIVSRILDAAPPPQYDGSGECFLAYSATQSASVGGTFLTPDGPQVGLRPPSALGMRSKERFERDWHRFRI
jgi:sulfide:quinone oxidoreductase